MTITEMMARNAAENAKRAPLLTRRSAKSARVSKAQVAWLRSLLRRLAEVRA